MNDICPATLTRPRINDTKGVFSRTSEIIASEFPEDNSECMRKLNLKCVKISYHTISDNPVLKGLAKVDIVAFQSVLIYHMIELYIR